MHHIPPFVALIAALADIDLNAPDAPFWIWHALLEHVGTYLLWLFASAFEGIARLFTSGTTRAYRWSRWEPPCCWGALDARWATRPPRSHLTLISQRRREAAQSRARWLVLLPRSQLEVDLSLFARGASTGKPADPRILLIEWVRENTQRAERAASAREGAHSHGRAANVSVYYFVTDPRASWTRATSQ